MKMYGVKWGIPQVFLVHSFCTQPTKPGSGPGKFCGKINRDVVNASSML